jgi:hypothetical protein
MVEAIDELAALEVGLAVRGDEGRGWNAAQIASATTRIAERVAAVRSRLARAGGVGGE